MVIWGLPVNDQAILRGALALQAKADCPDCPTGIDLSNVHFTVSLFANTLVANCAQVARSIYTATNQYGRPCRLLRRPVAADHRQLSRRPRLYFLCDPPGLDMTSTASPGECRPLFTEACKGVVPYVDQITR